MAKVATVLAVFSVVFVAAHCTTLSNIIDLNDTSNVIHDDSQWDSVYPDKTWTSFHSVSDPKDGTGDIENVYEWVTNLNKGDNDCPLWCVSPLAVEWKVMEPTNTAEIQQCATLRTSDFNVIHRGFSCFNSDQSYIDNTNLNPNCNQADHEAYQLFCQNNGMARPTRTVYECDLCPDFSVRYLCPTSYSGTCIDQTDLPSSNKRQFEMAQLDVKAREINKKRNTLFEEVLKERNAKKVQSKKSFSPNEEQRKSLLRMLKELLNSKV